jgi:hypothetical protein
MRLFYCLHVGPHTAKPAVIDVSIDITPFLVRAQMTMECLKSREVCAAFPDFCRNDNLVDKFDISPNNAVHQLMRPRIN